MISGACVPSCLDDAHSHQFHRWNWFVGKNICNRSLKNLRLIVQKRCSLKSVRSSASILLPILKYLFEWMFLWQCGGEGCNVCKKTGWIEIMGPVWFTPRVWNEWYRCPVYSSFAFEWQTERVAISVRNQTISWILREMSLLKQFNND